MAKRKVKSSATNLPISQACSEACTAMRELGDLCQDVLRLEAELNDKVAVITKALQEKAEIGPQLDLGPLTETRS